MTDAVGRRGALRQVRRERDVAVQHVADRLPQPTDVLRIACAGTHDRNAQQRLQRMQIDLKPQRLRLIHQVDADDQAFAARQQLQRKRQTARQTRRVAHGDHTGVRVRLQILCRDPFLLRPGFQRIRAWKIRYGVCLCGIGVCAVRHRDGLPWPVSCVLVQPGQSVENAAFADVRIPGQRDSAGRSVIPAHLTTSTMICAASSRRSANTAPPTA